MRQILCAFALFGVAIFACGHATAQIMNPLDPPLWTGSSTGTANQFSFQNFLTGSGGGACSGTCTEVNGLGTIVGNLAIYVQGGDFGNVNTPQPGVEPLYLLLGIPTGPSFTPSIPKITDITTYADAGGNSSGIVDAGSPSSGPTSVNLTNIGMVRAGWRRW